MFRRGLRYLGIAIILLLTACTPLPKRIPQVSPGGVPYTMHVDPSPWPCYYRGPDAGCYIKEGEAHHIMLTSVASWHVKRHEEGHVDGMRHEEWDFDGCTKVIVPDSTGRYKAGDKLCIRSMGEQIIRIEQ